MGVGVCADVEEADVSICSCARAEVVGTDRRVICFPEDRCKSSVPTVPLALARPGEACAVFPECGL